MSVTSKFKVPLRPFPTCTISPLTFLLPEKSLGQGEASGTVRHGAGSWFLELASEKMCVLVFGWDLILLSVLSDCCRGSVHTPSCLGSQPQPPSGPQVCAATPGLLCLLAPVLMTPGGHLDGILSYCLSPPTPRAMGMSLDLHRAGWGVGDSLRLLSLQTYLVAIPSLQSILLPPALVFQGCLLPGLREGSVAWPTLPLERQCCNCNSGEKRRCSYFRVYLAKC